MGFFLHISSIQDSKAYRTVEKTLIFTSTRPSALNHVSNSQYLCTKNHIIQLTSPASSHLVKVEKVPMPHFLSNAVIPFEKMYERYKSKPPSKSLGTTSLWKIYFSLLLKHAQGVCAFVF